MENIIKLFGVGAVILLIAVIISALIYPISFEIKFKSTYGKNGISYGWTICQLIGIIGTFSYASDTASDGFYEALGFTAIVFVIAMVRTYKRIKKMGLGSEVCIAATAAQFMAPIGIIFIVLLISSLLDKDDKSRKN